VECIYLSVGLIMYTVRNGERKIGNAYNDGYRPCNNDVSHLMETNQDIRVHKKVNQSHYSPCTGLEGSRRSRLPDFKTIGT
jgi:hypothetical protein